MKNRAAKIAAKEPAIPAHPCAAAMPDSTT